MSTLQTAKIVYGTNHATLPIKTWSSKTIQQIIKSQSDYLGLPKTSSKLNVTCEGQVVPLTASITADKTYTLSLEHEVLG